MKELETKANDLDRGNKFNKEELDKEKLDAKYGSFYNWHEEFISFPFFVDPTSNMAEGFHSSLNCFLKQSTESKSFITLFELIRKFLMSHLGKLEDAYVSKEASFHRRPESIERYKKRKALCDRIKVRSDRNLKSAGYFALNEIKKFYDSPN